MSTSGTALPTASPTPVRAPLRQGDRLLQMGLVSADQIQIALLEQTRTGKQLGDALIAMGFVTEEAMREALGVTLGQQTIQLQSVLADPEDVREPDFNPLGPRKVNACNTRHNCLPLPLLVLGVRADDPHDTLATHDLALVADLLD
mgnify:CR=1 FL=1